MCPNHSQLFGVTSLIWTPQYSQDVYSNLRSSLLERLHDKEPLVRASCVSALGKLSISEDPDEIDDDDVPILSYLMEALCYDLAA